MVAPHCRGADKAEIIEGVEVVRFRYAPARWENIAYGGGMMNQVRERPVRTLLLPFFFLSMFFAASLLTYRRNASIIHAHWIVPQGVAAALVKKLFFFRRIRVVVTSHGMDLYGLKGKTWKAVKKRVLLSCDAITVVNPNMTAEILACGDVRENRVHVAPMGADLNNLFVFSEGERPGLDEARFLFVGRLVEKKGVSFLIKAFSIINETLPGAKLTIVGDGPLKGDLEAQVKRLGIDRAVDFVGAVRQQELPTYYSKASVCIFPFIEAKDGDQEGLGLVVVEAMGCGCPVVAADVAALKGARLFNNNAALLCRQKDHEALATAMAKIINTDRNELAACTRENRQMVLGVYDWGQVGRNYIEIFEDQSI